ncbi:hypothetical protein WQ5_03005, partial [Enterococcus faecalis EnGen0339]
FIVIPPAIFFYYSTLFDSRFKTLQQNLEIDNYLDMIDKYQAIAKSYLN